MARSYGRQGLALRLENEAINQAAEDYNPEESLAIDQEAAAEVGEADMVEGEVAEVTDSIDDSVDAAEELGGEVIPQLAEAAAGEGLEPREAQALSARIERIAQKAGINPSSTGLVMRRENFASSAARKQQTRMRLEAAQGMLATIWENIKKAWAWVLDLISNTWNKWTSNIEGIKKRLNDLQSRITSLPAGATPKNSRLKVQAKFFSIDRNVTKDTIDKVIASVKGLATAAGGLRSELEKVTSGELKSLKGDGSSGDFVNGMIAVLTSGGVPNGARSRDKLSRTFKDGEKAEIKAVLGAFPAGRSLVVEQTTVTAGTKSENVAKAEMAVVEDSFADDYEAPKDKGELNALVNKGLEVANELIKSTKNKAELEEAVKRVMSVCDSYAKEATAFGDNDKNADNDALRNSVTVKVGILKSAQTIAKMLAAESPKMLFDTAAALGDMAAAGVSNMKEEKK